MAANKMKGISYMTALLFVGMFIVLAIFLGGNDTGGVEENGDNKNIPSYAIEVLQHIRSTGKSPSGYVGGRTFQNREKRLPQKNDSGSKIKYKEWDVHKKVKGKNRGAERLVTSKEDAYYTKDHYRSFIHINED